MVNEEQRRLHIDSFHSRSPRKATNHLFMFLLEVIHLCHDDGLLFSLLLGEVISSSWALSTVGSSYVSYSHSCSSSCSDSSWWSSSTCSIIIFSVDWAEVGYMFRGRVSSLNFVVS